MTVNKLMVRLPMVVAVALIGSCRQDTATNTDVGTEQFGAPGSGYIAQCSGWFPDWISTVPPAAGQTDFQLSQAYYLGVPVLATVGGQTTVTAYKRPPDAPLSDAPWLAYDFHSSGQPSEYASALLAYVLNGNAEAGFEIPPVPFAQWFNVPMMTTDSFTRREPLHGLTRERTLSHTDWSWINNGSTLRSYAIGYYNALGSYTVGQVFKDIDPSKADPTKASFVNGTLVFKILFSEYAPAKINTASYPLTHAPAWTIQDVGAPAAANDISVRLIQMDIAVKDARSPTGWVFATYDYDESNADPNPWKRLTAVGLMWGDDPTVNTPGQTLTETWLNPALPAAMKTHIGVDGRLIGPVDNPASSCISCHSTAQVDQGVAQSATGATSIFTGNTTIIPTSCTVAQRANWFRDLPSGTPFGMMDGTPAGSGCNVVAAPSGTTLRSMDNSLQLQVGLISSLYRGNPNPCTGKTPGQTEAPQAPGQPLGPVGPRRVMAGEKQRVVVSKELARALQSSEDGGSRR